MSSNSPNPAADDQKWLDTNYLLKILSSHLPHAVKAIKHFTVEPATAKGENYASMMLLVNAEYSTDEEEHNTISLIVKSRLENEIMSAIEEEFNVFNRESQVYHIIMKESEKLLESIGDNTFFGPRAVYIDEKIIVQENLKKRGYSIADVKTGLNFGQCKLVLEKLAKFHACSMVLYEKSPEIFKHHLPGNLTENYSPLHDLYRNAISTCIQYVRTRPDLTQYIPKLEDFGQKIVAKMINVFSRNAHDRFHVLNHGDCWVNNFMFNSKGDDVLFVDYQEGYFGSPGIDWNYFMYSSWQPNVLIEHKDELINCYQEVLERTLRKLHFEKMIPTVEDVKKEIANKANHGLVTATCLFPIITSEHPELADPTNFLLHNDETRANRFIVFKNPKYGDFLNLIFSEFLKD